ncbi:DUF4488 domain-containing protein [Longibacter salinarum]|nr:DUF4488 domain-containing protein [Longibacter salinarum]
MCPLTRRTSFLCLALLLWTAGSAFAQLPSNELEGTWRMVSQERVYPDSTVDTREEWGANYKILNSTHFAWGRETKNGEEVLAGGGRYEYHPERNIYVEHIEYHSSPGFQDVTLRFEAKVKGDRWIHVGDLGSYKLREVWERVDPQEAEQETVANSPVGNDDR